MIIVMRDEEERWRDVSCARAMRCVCRERELERRMEGCVVHESCVCVCV
jgi:hypothetical protein